MSGHIVLEEITQENIQDLSEEEVSGMLTEGMKSLPPERRSYYSKVLSTGFEFRTISTRNRALEAELEMFGYKFFKIPDESYFIIGIKRKHFSTGN